MVRLSLGSQDTPWIGRGDTGVAHVRGRHTSKIRRGGYAPPAKKSCGPTCRALGHVRFTCDGSPLDIILDMPSASSDCRPATTVLRVGSMFRGWILRPLTAARPDAVCAAQGQRADGRGGVYGCTRRERTAIDDEEILHIM